MKKRSIQRIYMFCVGVTILASLYLDIPAVMYILIGVLIIEAATNVRIVSIVAWLNDISVNSPSTENSNPRFNVDAERIWQICVASLLVISTLILPGTLWFFPWFLGFAVLGAGVSGVCPMIWTIRSLGFR